MGLLSRGNERALEGGVAGTARVLASKVLEPGSEPDADRYSTWDEVSRAFDLGRQPYQLKLEVTTDVHAPFEVEGRFKVPRKAESYSRFKQGRIRTGLELPVRVGSGNPPKVDIDWGRWMADPERKRKMDENEAYMREVTLQRMGQREAVAGWAKDVKKGRMSREDFEAAVRDEIEMRGMAPAVAEAARREFG